MAYCDRKNMALREFAVHRAIQEISVNNETFTYEDIANHIGCSVVTVKRAMRQLMKSKTVQQSGSARNGYRYEVTKNESASVL